MAHEAKEGLAVGVEILPGELYQVVLYKLRDGKIISAERPQGPHIWGHTKFVLEQQLTDRIYPPGVE